MNFWFIKRVRPRCLASAVASLAGTQRIQTFNLVITMLATTNKKVGLSAKMQTVIRFQSVLVCNQGPGRVLSPRFFASSLQWALAHWRLNVVHLGVNFGDGLPVLLDLRFADDFFCCLQS